MRSSSFLFSIVLLSVTLASLSQPVNPATRHHPRALPLANPTAIPSSQEIPEDLVITLERTVCYGICPSYKLTIKANGAVAFDGREFVKQKGLIHSKISQDRVRSLVSEFEKTKFFSLRNSYSTTGDGCQEVYTDHPSVTIAILMNGRTKQVRHYQGCRGISVLETLTNLETLIDKVVESDQWIK